MIMYGRIPIFPWLCEIDIDDLAIILFHFTSEVSSQLLEAMYLSF